MARPFNVKIDPHNPDDRRIIRTGPGRYELIYEEPFIIPENHHIILNDLSFYNSLPNSYGDDSLTMEYHDGTEWKELFKINYEEGIYDHLEIIEYTHSHMNLEDIATKLDIDELETPFDVIDIYPRWSTGRMIITTPLWKDHDLRIILTENLSKMLGFDEITELEEQNTQGSKRAVFSTNYNLIIKLPDLISSSIFNNNLHSSVLHVSQIVAEPREINHDKSFIPVPIPIRPGAYQKIEVVFENQNEQPVIITDPLTLKAFIQEAR